MKVSIHMYILAYISLMSSVIWTGFAAFKLFMLAGTVLYYLLFIYMFKKAQKLERLGK